VPAGARAQLTESLGSGGVLHDVPPRVLAATHEAYVYALQYGLRVGAVVALLGAVLAWVLVASRAQAMVPGGAHAEPRRADSPEAAGAEAVHA
jgi:hypothetical protein